MKILVLSGSPKSEQSATLQSVHYLINRHPAHDFKVIHLIRHLKDYEKGPDQFKPLLDELGQSDVVLWVFPVYHCLVPAHYKRFIELIFEYGFEDAFKDRYGAIFTTSVHFADNNAQDYLQGILGDLGMRFIDGLSHGMNDLLEASRRRELDLFFTNIENHVTRRMLTPRNQAPVPTHRRPYLAGAGGEKIATDRRIVVVTDATDKDRNLLEMIKALDSMIDGRVSIRNLHEVEINQYCLGCCHCGYDNTCAIKDGYRAFLDGVIKDADILIYALAIHDRYFSSRFKLYLDRSFTYNHVPIMRGKQVAYLVSGPVSHLENLRQTIQHDHQGDANLVGIVSDEAGDDPTIDALIRNLVQKAVDFSHTGYFRSPTFLGIAQRHIFSTMIRGFLGAIFRADYRYYQREGYLKPERPGLKERGTAVIMRHMMGKARFRNQVTKDMTRHMIASHVKFLEGEGSR